MRTYLKILIVVAVAPFLMFVKSCIGEEFGDKTYSYVEFKNNTDMVVYVHSDSNYPYGSYDLKDFVRVIPHGVYMTKMEYDPYMVESYTFFISVYSSLALDKAQKRVMACSCKDLLQGDGRIVFDGFEEEAKP